MARARAAVAFSAAATLWCAGTAQARRPTTHLRQVTTYHAAHSDPSRSGVEHGMARLAVTTWRVKAPVRTFARRMKRSVHGGDTPSFEIFPLRNAELKLISHPHPRAGGREAVPVYGVTGLGRSGVLWAEGLLPADGHLLARTVSSRTALPLHIAESIDYQVWIDYEDGTRTALPLVRARGNVTHTRLVLPLKRGHNLVHFAPRRRGARQTTDATGTFLPGRSKVLIWDGN
jgi:hypothetical protein